MNNIVFIINSVGSGGAETALFNIIKAAPQLDNSKIHLVLLDDEVRLKTLPDNVTLHQLNSQRSLFKSIWQCYKLLKHVKAHVVVSFLVRANIVNSVLRSIGLYKASIVCERMHLTSHLELQFSGIKARLSKALPRILYNRNDLVLGVSTGVTQNLVTAFAVSKAKAKTIFNPYDIESLKSKANKAINEGFSLPQSFIVSVGRLTKSKDQKTLIAGYAKSNTTIPLVIMGTGDLLDELKRLCVSLGLEKRVHFLGYQQNPYAIIKRASFFISSSRNEGFPNALLEAMALGKACIFTSCDSGPAEIFGSAYDHKAQSVETLKYGILIPEGHPDELAQAIKLLSDESKRLHYENMSKLRSQDFLIENIAAQYWREILCLLKT